VRDEALTTLAELCSALESRTGKISADDMDYEQCGRRRAGDVCEVVREFREKRGHSMRNPGCAGQERGAIVQRAGLHALEPTRGGCSQRWCDGLTTDQIHARPAELPSDCLSDAPYLGQYRSSSHVKRRPSASTPSDEALRRSAGGERAGKRYEWLRRSIERAERGGPGFAGSLRGSASLARRHATTMQCHHCSEDRRCDTSAS